MPSKRIYITLNSDREKDRIIESYLSQSYSESDAIKEAIYRLATNSSEKVKLIPKDNKKVQKGGKSTNKVERVTNDNEKILKVANSTQLLSIDTVSTHKSQLVPNDDITIDLSQYDNETVMEAEIKSSGVDKDKSNELNKKKLKALKQFM